MTTPENPGPGQPAPHGQPPPYGYPPQSGYPPQPGYPPPYGYPPSYGNPPHYGYPPPYGYPAPYGYYERPSYAGWWTRVASYLLDSLLALPLSIAAGIVYQTTSDAPSTSWTTDLGSMTAVGLVTYLVLNLLGIAVQGWNRWYRAGRTGQSIGKSVTNTYLVFEATGQTIGGWRAFARDLLHILDALCFVGYIYAAFDDKTQTFADKIMKTIVVTG